LFSVEIFLAENRIEEAITIAEKIILYDSGGINPLASIPSIRDLLARAYIQNDEMDRAINEYERLTTYDPKNKDRRLTHPKYHYCLAKLYEDTDNKEQAITKYKRFLEIWINADKDQPELIDAKKRLAQLTRGN
jgi:tetratricopeptide (TPR) repeat protein